MPQEKQAVTVPARSTAPAEMKYILRLLMGTNPVREKSELMLDPRSKAELIIKSLIDPDRKEAFTLPWEGGPYSEHDDIAKILGFNTDKTKAFNRSYPALEDAIRKGMVRYGGYASEYLPGTARERELMFHYTPRPESHQLVESLLERQSRLFPSKDYSVSLRFADPKYPIFQEPRFFEHLFGDKSAWGHHPAYRGPSEKALEFIQNILSRPKVK